MEMTREEYLRRLNFNFLISNLVLYGENYTRLLNTLEETFKDEVKSIETSEEIHDNNEYIDFDGEIYTEYGKGELIASLVEDFHTMEKYVINSCLVVYYSLVESKLKQICQKLESDILESPEIRGINRYRDSYYKQHKFYTSLKTVEENSIIKKCGVFLENYIGLKFSDSTKELFFQVDYIVRPLRNSMVHNPAFIYNEIDLSDDKNKDYFEDFMQKNPDLLSSPVLHKFLIKRKFNEFLFRLVWDLMSGIMDSYKSLINSSPPYNSTTQPSAPG